MQEETHGKRRIIVRRRSNGESGSATGTYDGTTGSHAGASATGTIGSRNSDSFERNTEPTDESADDDRSESEGMYSPARSESQRIGSDRSGRTETDDGYTLNFGTTDTDNSGRSGSGRTEGTPRRTRRKRQTAKGALLVEQDQEDVKNIVIAIGDAGANATGFEGLQITEPEALTIAKPAARILQRHGAVAETIRTIADPLALIIATATVFGPRLAAYKMYRETGATVQQPVYPHEAQQTPQTEPQPETNVVNMRQRVTVTDDNLQRKDAGLFNQFQ